MEQSVSIETYKQVCIERDIAIEQLRQLGYEFGEETKRKIKDEDRIPDEMAIKILDNISYVLDDGSKVKKAYNQGIEALQERIERERIKKGISELADYYNEKIKEIERIHQSKEIDEDELDRLLRENPSMPIEISVPSNDKISASLVDFCKGVIAAEESKENKND